MVLRSGKAFGSSAPIAPRDGGVKKPPRESRPCERRASHPFESKPGFAAVSVKMTNLVGVNLHLQHKLSDTLFDFVKAFCDCGLWHAVAPEFRGGCEYEPRSVVFDWLRPEKTCRLTSDFDWNTTLEDIGFGAEEQLSFVMGLARIRHK
ncbi:hypothetical protein CYMTET_44292 [Cymbomonas tetramitiformis]|uniref:Uncharacterized protein n=1 Tax=Cymbomonas tetramitiformis TaxID=36881 RepID=A0AAE0C2A4_9CHLO|nr:hypothetical protein CYMTET_44292 [Cymbomonas tetramitiformis]